MNLGRFKAVPTKHGLVAFGQDKDIVKMAVEFKLLEGPSIGQSITGFFGFKGKGEDFTTNVMTTCGWDGETEDLDAPWDYQQVYLVLDNEDYKDDQGNPKQRVAVKYVNALDDKGRESGALIEKHKIDVGNKKQFTEGLMASIRAKRAAAGEAPKAASKGLPADDFTGAGGAAGDEEIPF